ncbi:MAG: glycogen/starch synthase, partial [Chitinophagales bacterium]|nr:glycogen/starch synthase [Chitinophagales bacterium]
METLHISAECFPAAKVGGLADVVGALPKYLNRREVISRVVIPCYQNKFRKENLWENTYSGNINLGIETFSFSIQREQTNKLGFELYVVDLPELLKEENPYGYTNDIERHLGFQIAVVNWISSMKKKPDVIHCHDHHTGLIAFMMNYCNEYVALKSIPTVFTIHNGNYQGWIGWEKENLLPAFDLAKRGMLEWNNCINSMACAIKCCWRFTTVSEGYLEELSKAALGLESLIRSEKQKAIGILNGIDTEVWDPETDPMIEKNYGIEKAEKGKKKNKEALCKSFQFENDKPLFAFIGRLVADKGADLLPNAITQIVLLEKLDVNFIVLGSGSADYENNLKQLKERFPKNFNCVIGYNEKLAHLIYAGSDFLLMPSRTEPCGLNLLYALRYGTVP